MEINRRVTRSPNKNNVDEKTSAVDLEIPSSTLDYQTLEHENQEEVVHTPPPAFPNENHPSDQFWQDTGPWRPMLPDRPVWLPWEDSGLSSSMKANRIMHPPNTLWRQYRESTTSDVGTIMTGSEVTGRISSDSGYGTANHTFSGDFSSYSSWETSGPDDPAPSYLRQFDGAGDNNNFQQIDPSSFDPDRHPTPKTASSLRITCDWDATSPFEHCHAVFSNKAEYRYFIICLLWEF